MKNWIALTLLVIGIQASRADQYSVHPIAKDMTLKAGGDRWQYFFQLPSHVPISQDCVLGLDYESSSILGVDPAKLVVSVNQKPLEATALATSTIPKHWRVVIPRTFLQPGFNQVSIATSIRSTAGPCLEDEGATSWVRFLHSSLLQINLASPRTYPLAAFPFPYIDWLSEFSPIASIVVPKTPSTDTLSSALTLASSFGERFNSQPVRIRIGQNPTIKYSTWVGLKSEFGSASPVADLQAQGNSLWITGSSAKQLNDAVRTISNPKLTSQMEGFSAVPLDNLPPEEHALTKVGSTTFRDLGLPLTTLSGLGDQRTSLVVYHPLNGLLGRNSKLKIDFHHASTLWRSKSMLAVSINNQPIGNVALTPENANDGELLCNIPVSLINSSSWTIDIVAHQEVANPDCAKRYEGIAWTTLLGTSVLTLKEGSIPYHPYLDGFPYFRDQNGLLPTVLTVGLNPHPSDLQLSLAATLIARATQTNRQSADWRVSSAPISGQEALILGSFADEDRFQPIRESLLIQPQKSGIPLIKKGLPILPETLNGAVVFQAIRTKAGGTSYVVLSSDDAALTRFWNFYTSENGSDGFKGQVCIFTNAGAFFSFDTLSQADRKLAEDAEMSRYIPQMHWVAIAIVAVLVLIALWIARQFIKKKAPKTEAS